MVLFGVNNDLGVPQNSRGPFTKGREMADQEDAEYVIKKLIEEYVGDHWAKTQTVCFLSSIGIYLKNSTAENRSVLSKGLREFLRRIPSFVLLSFLV